MTLAVNQNFDAVAAMILAAGRGTRMKSAVPKVLHSLAGRPVLEWVKVAVTSSGVTDITVVLSADLSPFQRFLDRHVDVKVAIQKGQKGTGDAVASAADAFQGVVKPPYADGGLHRGTASKADWILIVTGDTPAISAQTLRDFVASTLESNRPLAVLGMNIEQPFGYGRLIRDLDGGLVKIVEERDADAQTKKIQLCNSGIVMAKRKDLFDRLAEITPQNSQKEYYLTDIFALSAKRGQPAHVFETFSEREFLGVNDRSQLETLESWLIDQRLKTLMQGGVTIHRPQSVYLEASAEIEADCEICPGVSLRGATKIGAGSVIGPATDLDNVKIEKDVRIGAGCVLSNLVVKANTCVAAGTVSDRQDLG